MCPGPSHASAEYCIVLQVEQPDKYRPIIGLSGCTSTCASARACRQPSGLFAFFLWPPAFVAVAGLRGGMGMDVNKGVHGSCVDF
jgi:hypothetical protein